ncbi:MAG: hypothetical protein IKN24_08000 [Lachnospiraceae bacterium]|nr:hypothetical protein [Lachnospiraceae bacterium]
MRKYFLSGSQRRRRPQFCGFIAILRPSTSHGAKDIFSRGPVYGDLSRSHPRPAGWIRAAGLGAAMANALPEVRYITAGNDEDGIAELIEKKIL